MANSMPYAHYNGQHMTHMIKFRGLSLSLALLLIGLSACVADPEDIHNPNTPASPSPGSSSSPSTVGTPLPVARVAVQVQIQSAENQLIQGAEISLSSPTQPGVRQSTDASGRTTFQDLRQDAEYSFEVSAPGYQTTTRKANLSQLVTQGQSSILVGIVLNALNTSIQGRVLDNTGQPVVGATVFDSRQSVSTNGEGRFTLGYAASSGELRLAVTKSGYQSLSRSISVESGQKQDLGDLTMTRRTGPLQLGFDNTHSALGQSSGSSLGAYSGLQSTISAQGYQIQTLNSSLSEQLDSLDALMILSPATAFNVEDISAIQAFVLSGRKLIVSGEWAGFGSFDGLAANQLLAPYNLQFGLDTLRENNQGFLSVSNFLAHPVTNGLSSLHVYQSGSVRSGSGDAVAQLLARTGVNSFQIAANTGSFAIVAASSYGSGKVVIVGDTSLWSDQDSDGNGVANLNEADNKRLLQQILDW